MARLNRRCVGSAGPGPGRCVLTKPTPAGGSAAMGWDERVWARGGGVNRRGVGAGCGQRDVVAEKAALSVRRSMPSAVSTGERTPARARMRRS